MNRRNRRLGIFRSYWSITCRILTICQLTLCCQPIFCCGSQTQICFCQMLFLVVCVEVKLVSQRSQVSRSQRRPRPIKGEKQFALLLVVPVLHEASIWSSLCLFLSFDHAASLYISSKLMSSARIIFIIWYCMELILTPE